MDGGALHSIGELARRTGLTVKTVRFYSDRGIVAPARRSPAGHRLYGTDAVARLDLVRTLRDLGLDLPTIRKVLERELSLPEVAAAHAEALAVRIRVLRLRRAVLTAVAERGSTPEELDLMHRLATLSEDERRRLVGEFLAAVFGGGHGDAAGSPLAAAARSMTPELPDNPGTEQVRAWVELAELSQDPDFRARLRALTEDHVEESARLGGPVPRRGLVALVRDRVGPALAAAVDAASPSADPVVDGLTAHYANLLGHPDDAALREQLLVRLERANDPRRERYGRLVAVVNGWPAPESLAPALDWTLTALRARRDEVTVT
ncbi:MerR family transcriptional regulator [Streptomyces liangshanensis]|uniref:MerR family transcriptional regulator n=1 Tax=Streptomyces liangshanensis TaxID=2717324 RepID=A0A6G9H0U7_9ACTN|nr:MerR family transcriptional regulator [Streptomyces liangshanensis]QIQ04090.1 MerR family transcriptional regulator [Streptomyces liangshanensis]